MSRPPRLTLIVNNDAPCPGDNPGSGQSSWSNRFEPYALRAGAADLWSAYFHARFNSPREVALFFDVSFQTALNWWGAVTAPASHIALLVLLTDPGAPGFFHDELRRAAA
ncbi:hypothetical protein [Antarcticimicrobium luteum]|uniref:Uncharacterized protein n=1 Tax=Antarcticimicrobium luteum TaxID=2547397 RepID=A0A4R5VFI1_9RHOB|nr:hypothetical protein [Antarcticimicrobium luteum]TDK51152.1 hypothetical protein E1832_04060 [Antarcticimicrobium luteum]